MNNQLQQMIWWAFFGVLLFWVDERWMLGRLEQRTDTINSVDVAL